MSDQFVCSVCGETHDGPILDWAFKLPDEVWAIPEPERSERAQFNSDLCVFDNRQFIRGILYIPCTGSDRQFGWGAWAEVDGQLYDRYVEIYDEDGSSEPLYAGTLANELPVYDEALGTPILIRLRDSKNRPLFLVRDEIPSTLADEQRNGIDEARLSEINHMISDRRA